MEMDRSGVTGAGMAERRVHVHHHLIAVERFSDHRTATWPRFSGRLGSAMQRYHTATWCRADIMQRQTLHHFGTNKLLLNDRNSLQLHVMS